MSDDREIKPSPIRVRAELLDRVMADLLGPVGGPEEEIDERNVRDRYLVGMLAPKRQEIDPAQQDNLAVGGREDLEEGEAEDSAPASKSMFPASIGMTFCVAREAESFSLTATWGFYSRVHSEYQTTDTGQAKMVWKRTPRGGTPKIVQLEERGFTFIPDEEQPEIYIQGIIRERDDHWSVTVFLINGQEEQETRKDEAWIFQPKVAVDSPDGSPIFHRRPSRRRGSTADPLAEVEEQDMAMLYRNQVEFAIGHGVAVHVETAEGETDRAVSISTNVAPTHEVPISTPPTEEDFPKLAGLCLDMEELSETDASDLEEKLRPVLVAYDAWIEEREAELDSDDMAEHQEAGRRALEGCREARERIAEGLALLRTDKEAAEAFRFANRAMHLQRVRSIYAQQRRRGIEVEIEDVDIPRNRSWYPFQLAFILLTLPGVTKLDHPDRGRAPTATADLLWFPTGGGKTEAYLGLAAYTMAIRRLQGTIEGRSGEYGVSVLMRYTLRLLTVQQFQRAATLICACEQIRKEDNTKWGEEPFRLGLWVGRRTTPNTNEQSSQAIAEDHGKAPKTTFAGIGSPAQLTNCPWCGTAIHPGRDIKVESYGKGRCLTVIYCGDKLGRCPFSARQSDGEGIPVLVVDEEIYRRLPTMLIATVDKFAQMPWKGAVQMLFGQVTGRCSRHGFISPEIEDKEFHHKTKSLPAASTEEFAPLRPPDLIIQDELHLISGPLGTLVGHYETAIDKLCSWEVDGQTVRPKVIASTATIRRSQTQVHNTFLRKVSVFPPHGLEVRDNFFSLQREPGPDYPGRLYLGICSPGRRFKVALIRVFMAFLAAAQQLFENPKYGEAVDPWMTLVGYFNSMRELGGMRRLVEDDIRNRLRDIDQRGLSPRQVWVDELTSRKGSDEIPDVLDHMETPFDPEIEALRREEGRKKADLPRRPIDVLLATNMVSVGVDIKRLGLMVTAGQPKTTAEYIQATSRVGRQREAPGIVCTVHNWARPRDLSHYETFEHYHATFYKHVEALSVTPYAPGAISRGLTALLASCVRLSGPDFNENHGAEGIEREHPYVVSAIRDIVERAGLTNAEDGDIEALVSAELNERLDEWLSRAQDLHGGARLGYDTERDGKTLPLLRRPGIGPWDPFTCLNSLRNVEPPVGLVLEDWGLDGHYGSRSNTDITTDGGSEPQ
jgi:hypothetical protein